MSDAKSDYIQRLHSLKKSINSNALSNRPPHEVEHNEVAKILRNGLAVVGFATLEDFIKRRCSEVLNEIGGSVVPFSKLPDKIQKAATYEAISALNYQLKILREHSEKTSYIQEHALKISSTANSSYEITPHAFAYNQPNVSDRSVKNILNSFNVIDPWRKMSSISSRIGLTTLTLEQSYKNAANRRHKAAHVASADIPQVDLDQFVNESFAIAIGFDSLLSKALSKIKNDDDDYLSGKVRIESSDIGIRFMKYVDNKWKEFSEGSSRAYRVSNDHSSLRADAMSRAKNNGQLYIEFNKSGLVEYWVCN
jgi:hypothetical protein